MIARKYEKSILRFICWIFVPAILLIFAILRFEEWQSRGLWGDDLYNFLHHGNGPFWMVVKEALTHPYASKYRPVFSLVWASWKSIFGLDLQRYHLSLLLLHALNAWIFFLLALRMSKGAVALSLVMAVVLACSRFALFQVSQLTGLIEALAFTFFLLMLLALACERGAMDAQRRILALAAFSAAVFTHERYLFAVPWLSVMLWCTFTGSKENRCRIVYTLAPWFLLVANFLIKTALLRMDFLVGTEKPSFDFSPLLTWNHFLQATSSLAGFNRGPEYLTGRQIFFENPLHTPGDLGLWALGAGYLIALGIAIVSGFRRAPGASRLVAMALISLMLLSIVPPVLTIRLEQRWLFLPMALILLTLAWSIGVSGTLQKSGSLAAAFLACGMLFCSDLLLSRSVAVTYMGYGASIGNFAADVISNKEAGPPGTPIILQTYSGGCGALLDGEYFQLYEGASRKMFCALDLSEVRQISAQMPSAKVFLSRRRGEHSDFYLAPSGF